MSKPLAWRRWTALISLLLIQYFSRAHQITAQAAFIDESYHNQRAVLVWQFTENPGLFSNGKVLLYYWLGLFEGDRSTALFVSRTAIALFSLISGAAIYRIGTRLCNFQVGLLALALYVLMPLAVFHERMALADPFAGGFACLVLWRSLAFVQRPRWIEAAGLGVLLALASLAKLTMGLLPMLPLGLSIINSWQASDSNAPREKMIGWARRYFLPLCVMAVIFIAAWLPLVIPAYAARNTDQPFVLINEKNIDRADSITPTLAVYLSAVTTVLYEFLGIVLPIGFGVWVGLALILILNEQRNIIGYGRNYRRDRQLVIVIGLWIFCLVGPSIVFASQVTARYYMPIAAPLSVLLAYAADRLWRLPIKQLSLQWVLRVSMLTLSALWIFTFALPFVLTAMTAPDSLPFSGYNANQYLRGIAPANQWVLTIAADLNRAPIIPIYGEWEICNQLYFYARPPVICFPRPSVPDPESTLTAIRAAAAKSPMMLALNTLQLTPADLPGICAVPIENFTNTRIPDETPSLWLLGTASAALSGYKANPLCSF